MSQELAIENLDALVLAGGESRRMGLPKASLPLEGMSLIGTVIAGLRPLFRQVMVVARDGEGLDGLGVEVVTDDRPERGPLVGLARGLAASNAPWCFVVGCDMPFLQPQIVRRMARHLGEGDVVAARLEGHIQPLHAFYAQSCLPFARRLLEEGFTSPRALFRLCRVRTVEASEFLDLDPGLLSFKDLDTKEDYQAALQAAQGLLREALQ